MLLRSWQMVSTKQMTSAEGFFSHAMEQTTSLMIEKDDQDDDEKDAQNDTVSSDDCNTIYIISRWDIMEHQICRKHHLDEVGTRN